MPKEKWSENNVPKAEKVWRCDRTERSDRSDPSNLSNSITPGAYGKALPA